MLKSRVRARIEGMSETTEQYSESVHLKITEVEDLMIDAEKLTNRSHDIDVFRRYQGMTAKLISSHLLETKQPEFLTENSYLKRSEYLGVSGQPN